MATKENKRRRSVPLAPEKVIAIIRKIRSKHYRKLASREFYRQITIRKKTGEKIKLSKWSRHGSKHFAKIHPNLGITPEERRDMAILYSLGASYRAIEEFYHLKPNNGNDSYRCLETACKKDKALCRIVYRNCKKNKQALPAIVEEVLGLKKVS